MVLYVPPAAVAAPFSIKGAASAAAPYVFAASSIAQAAGAAAAAKASQAQANSQAQVREQQAVRERQAAAAEERDFRRAQQREMARRRAILGGSGVEIGTGSPLLASEDLAREVELQALRVRDGGEVRATRLEQQADLDRLSGRSARTTGHYRAGASLLRGIGNARYYGRRA